MDSSNKLHEQIEAIDKLFPGPNERAHEIWSLIGSHPDLIERTDWDWLCFCVEFIAMQSQQFPYLEELAKELNRLLYIAHYNDRYSDAAKSERRRNIAVNPDSKSDTDRESTSISNRFTPSRHPFE